MFGDTSTEPASELTPFRPASPYGVSKAAAHWMVASYRKAYGLYACSGILFNHESPLRKERFVTQKIVRAAVDIHLGAKRRLQLGNISVTRDWGWAPDYVEAMWLMLQQPEADDFVIATGKPSTLQEFVAAAFGRPDIAATLADLHPKAAVRLGDPTEPLHARDTRFGVRDHLGVAGA